jgi:uncharacterized protein (DUF362 family)
MIGVATTGINMKTVLAIISFFALLGGIAMQTPTSANSVCTPEMHTVDPFTKDIQTRSSLVYNAVAEVVNQQGKQSPVMYKQTCETSIAFIQKERLNTEYNYNILNVEQKELTSEYRDYLTESANVIYACYTGNTPDLTKMYDTRDKLF